LRKALSRKKFRTSGFSPALEYYQVSMGALNIVTLTQQNFQQEVLQASKPVLVDFWAEWCGPCKMLAPILDELAQEYDGKVTIGKVNIDEHQDLAAQYGIRSIPTLLLFRDGQVADQIVGLRSKRDLKASFDRVAA
jgi:thioredoxin 1